MAFNDTPLQDLLKEHPLHETLTDPAPSFPDCLDREKWDGLTGETKRLLEEAAAPYAELPWPQLLAEQYLAYTREGSRVVWEKPYFDRRRKLIALLLLICERGAAPEDRAVTELINGLWLICEESTWVISAHAEGHILPEAETPGPDLFAAQTGMILSLTLRLAGCLTDKVSPGIAERVKREIEGRVLKPFEERDDLWWMGFGNHRICNWTPWIVSNVMLCACCVIGNRERLCRLLERACVMLDKYIASMPEDGSCDEGTGYWNMAGGCLLDALELLEKVTGGRFTLWENEKLKGILSFPGKTALGGGWFINFADCDARPYLCPERLITAGKKTDSAGLTRLGSSMPRSLLAHLTDTPQLWRLLQDVFREEEKPGTAEAGEDVERDLYMRGLQVRVLTRNGVTLACKGGHNGENHNHNDVGSFMLYDGGVPVLADAGNVVYSAKTFSDARYTQWNTRSVYHNLPLIGGREQQAGERFRALNVIPSEDGLSLDMARAWAEDAGVLLAERVLSLSPEGDLTLTDRILTREAVPCEWVFLLREKPKTEENALLTGHFRIICSLPLTVSVEELSVTDPRMQKSFPGSLWRVLFREERPAAERTAVFTVKRF